MRSEDEVDEARGAKRRCRPFALWAVNGAKATYVGSAVGTSVSDACVRLALASPWFAKDFDATTGTWRGQAVSEGHYEDGV